MMVRLVGSATELLRIVMPLLKVVALWPTGCATTAVARAATAMVNRIMLKCFELTEARELMVVVSNVDLTPLVIAPADSV
jgi:hypothetical protein